MTDMGPLADVAWLRAHLDDSDLRLVHVSVNRGVYALRHVPGAVFGALHGELAEEGPDPVSGAVREYLVPSADHVGATLGRWGVRPGDRVVFYDDVGRNRQAIRGYWLLRLYGWPSALLRVLDGGLPAWMRAGLPVTRAVPDGEPAPAVTLGAPDSTLLATADDVLAWSRESGRDGEGGGARGPVRILDVRTPAEYSGDDVRALRGGHVPGAVNLEWSGFLHPDGTFRSAAEIRARAEAAVGDATGLRAAYCQGGVRAALAWFALSELAGLPVRSYAGSWEEWGNRTDLPVES